MGTGDVLLQSIKTVSLKSQKLHHLEIQQLTFIDIHQHSRKSPHIVDYARGSKNLLFIAPLINSPLTFTVWLMVLFWIWKCRVFAASVSHLIALVIVICESVCAASEWANISFESMWNLHASLLKKSVDGAAINGGSVKSEGSVTHGKPRQRSLYWGRF